MNKKPIYSELVMYQHVLTYKDDAANSDKIYIVEVVCRKGEPDERCLVARARYGRNDGRRLTVCELRADELGYEWSVWKVAEKRLNAKLRKEYSVADTFLALCVIAADNENQRIEQIECDWENLHSTVMKWEAQQ